MKILTKEEKKAKKQEYKKGDIDIFFDPEEAFQHNLKPETRQFVPDFYKTKDFDEYNKRGNKYFYHYRRLLAKRDFLHKRILNLNCFEKEPLFKNEKNFELMSKVFRYNKAEKAKERMQRVMGYVSDYKAVEKVNIFIRSVLEFSVLIKQLTDIVDTVDPKNKDKFVYDRTKMFHDKMVQTFNKIKMEYFPTIAEFCKTLFR